MQPRKPAPARVTPPPAPPRPQPNGADPARRKRIARVALVTWYRRRDNYTVLWGQRADQAPQVLAEWFSREPLYADWYDLLEREVHAARLDPRREETAHAWAITVKAGEAPAPWYKGPPLQAEERVLSVVVCEPAP